MDLIIFMIYCGIILGIFFFFGLFLIVFIDGLFLIVEKKIKKENMLLNDV